MLLKIIIILNVILVLLANNLSAGSLQFDPGTKLKPATEWTAGIDLTEQWYGSNFNIENGYAELTETSRGNTSQIARTGVNSILFAFELNSDIIGSYTWSIDSLFSDYNTQYNYGQIFLMNNGQTVRLNKEIWNKPPNGAETISSAQPQTGTADLNWHKYGNSFDIIQVQVSNYEYIAIVFTGSKHTEQVLRFDALTSYVFDGVMHEVPEPSTVAIAGLGLLLMLKKTK